MYIVRFVRTDGKCNEEYYYHELEQAKMHMNCFKEDGANLYERIEVIDFETPNCVYDAIVFPCDNLGRWGRLRYEYLVNSSTEQYKGFVVSGELREHLIQVEQEAQETFEELLKVIQESDLSISYQLAIVIAEEYALKKHVYK